METPKIVDVEKIVEHGKAILKGETLPKSSEDVKKTLESFGSEVEQVRYAEGEKLSTTGQAVLKDLEEILIGGAEVTSTIPPETFLHAARAQQKIAEAAGPANPEEVSEEIAMNFASLLRMLFTSNEFRDVVSDWSNWLKDVLVIQIEEANKKTIETSVKESEEGGIGQVPTEEIETAPRIPKVKDEQLDKLIGMLEWMQERKEYQVAIGYIFNQLSNISSILGIDTETGEEAEEEMTVVDKDKLKEAMKEAKAAGLDTLKALENWTHHPTESFKTHLTTTAEHLKSDVRLRSSLQSLAHFLSNCFNEPGFLNDRQWVREEARDRLDQVREFFVESYKSDFRGLADEARDLIKSLDREPRTAQLKQSLRKLLEDLFIVSDQPATTGIAIDSFRLKTELLSDMGLIVGGILQRAKYLRVPDIEVHDEDLDFTAHNIILDAAELIPQQFKMTLVTENMVEKVKHEAEFGKEKEGGLTEEEKERIFVQREPPIHQVAPIINLSAPSPSWQTHLKFEVKGIHGHCRNVYFNVRKRTGFPQITDEGLADLRVWGAKGMLIKVVLRPEWIKEETIEREVHTKETIGNNSTITFESNYILETLSSSAVPSISTSTFTAVKPDPTSPSPPPPTITTTQKFKLAIVKAHCEIDELELDLHGTRKDWFYTVMGPLVRKRVKSALELAVERNLLTLMD